MESNIRVLMITSEYPGLKHPESVPFIRRQVNSLRENGIDVDVFPFSGRKQLMNYVRAWRDLRKFAAGKRYDLVHAQWGHSAVLALPKSLPWVITFRGNDLEGIVGRGGNYTLRGRVQTMISRLMARLADEIIIVSESLARHLPHRSYHVIPSGLDLELFRPIPKKEARQFLGLPSDKRLVLFAASTITNPRKRYSLAKSAVELIQDEFDAELVVASKVAHSSMPYYMSACDALLLTSVHEGSPNVVKEALACELPVVSVNVGDVKRRLSNIDGCVVVEDESPAALAAALKNVLRKPYRINGRASVMELDEQIITEKVIEVYSRALNGAERKNQVRAIGGERKESA